MARKKAPRRGPLAILVSAGLAIPREATRRTAAGIRDTIAGQVGGSIDIVDRMAQRYGLPRAQIAKLLNETLANVSSPGEAIKAVQDLAMSLPGGAIKRAQGATATSIGIFNDIAGRVGLPTDVLLSTLLAAVGKDWEQLARRQREKIRKAQAVLERLRQETEEAEEDLAEILGSEYPISWHAFTQGLDTVQDELQKELHALKGRPAATAPSATAPVTPETGPPQRAAQPPKPSVRPKAATKTRSKPSASKPSASKSSAKKKAAAKRSAPASKPKPKPKPKPKSKPRPKPKPKSKPKARAKPKAK